MLELITPHRCVVVPQGAGKLVGAVAAGDEIKVIDRSRIGGRLQGCAAGAGDGAGGQAGDPIGIVGGDFPQVTAGEVAVEILDAVDDCGVGLQGDAPLQANGS